MENEGIDNIHKAKSRTELLDEAEAELNRQEMYAQYSEQSPDETLLLMFKMFRLLIEAMR